MQFILTTAWIVDVKFTLYEFEQHVCNTDFDLPSYFILKIKKNNHRFFIIHVKSDHDQEIS